MAVFFALIGLSACGNKPEPPLNEVPKGYVEFYMPETRLGGERVDVDAQVYRIDNGRREFLGMTREWKHLAEPRRGLTVSVSPGARSFLVAYGSAEAPVAVMVEEGTYRRVRIQMTELGEQQMIGATRQLHFVLKAAVDPAP